MFDFNRRTAPPCFQLHETADLLVWVVQNYIFDMYHGYILADKCARKFDIFVDGYIFWSNVFINTAVRKDFTCGVGIKGKSLL